ncbi:MAG: GDP-mannose 4,6-dehydratase [Candidatus Accumulibacter sp.]|nr:GDP-mannose 4,6-dehydratase [Accumulibacter sp.]
MFGALPYRSAELWRCCGDASKARDQLGWRPKTPFAQGIASVIPWYREALRNGQLI